VLRRVLTCAAGVGVVLLAATACSPVKMGSAAVVGSDRITVTQLDDQVNAFNQVYPKYKSEIQLTSSKIPGEVLSWLIRFQIMEQFASDHGITVNQNQVDTAIKDITTSGEESAAESGVTNFSLELLLVANGIPPGMENELGRYQAIEDAYLTQVNGGKAPSTTAEEDAASKKLQTNQCSTAKSLNIQVSPQYGTFNYSQYSVTSTPDLLSAASGQKPATVSAGSC
jgi:SurA N-terminal domain